MSEQSRGARWRTRVLDDYEFGTPSDLEIVDIASETLDRLEVMQQELSAGDLMVPGNRPGTFVANPLLTEIRLTTETFARLVKQLDLPDLEDEEDAEVVQLSRSDIARKSALKRYNR